jgi:hypothetical protein
VTGLDEMTTVAALQTRLRHAEAALARIRELLDAATPHDGHPPANGTLLIAEYRGGPQQVDDERAWLRDDQAHADPCGDWFWIGAKDRRSWGEVMWWDDPDRGTVHLTAYLPVDDLRNALGGAA